MDYLGDCSIVPLTEESPTQARVQQPGATHSVFAKPKKTATMTVKTSKSAGDKIGFDSLRDDFR
jgi:hypothetical protein